MASQELGVNQELYETIYNADKTIQKVFELKYGKDMGPHVARICGEEDYRKEAEKNLSLAQQQKKSRKQTLWAIPILLLPIAIALIVFIAFVAWIADEVFNVYLPEEVLLIAIPLSLITCIVLFITTYKRKNYEKFYEVADECECLANKKAEELESLIKSNQHYISAIAPEFRYPVATRELVRIFQLGRATTLPEAYDKLELKLHQLKVEEGLGTLIALQTAQLSLLNNVEYNTRWI